MSATHRLANPRGVPWRRGLTWTSFAMAAAGLVLLLLALGAIVAPAPALAAGDPATLIQHGRWREARALLEPRVAASPTDAEAAFLLSRVRSAFRDADGSLELAERAVKLDGSNARYHEQLAEALGDKTQHAGPLAQLGLAKRFKKEAEAAVALDPRSFNAQTALMIFHLKAPGIVGGDKHLASAKVEEIARLDPLQGEFARARFAAETGDSLGALAHWRKAVELRPDDYDARLGLATWLAAHFDAEAEKHALEAKRIDPGRGAAYSVLAMIYAHAGRWDDLDATLAAVETNLPGNRLPHYQAARVLVTENRELARAERYLRGYLTIEPEGGGPSHAGARWRLAQALEKEGRKDEAIAELEAAVKAQPDFDPAKKELKRMRRRA